MKEGLRKIEIDLGERSYSIYLGYDLLPQRIADLAGFSREKEVFIISDTQVNSFYGKRLEDLLLQQGYQPSFYLIKPGEEAKTWDNAEKILDVMLTKNLSRKVPLLALGGGVVGDLAGFVAALYKRGIPFIQIPTTLLAQVDSSVGGKVAVNHSRGKNLLGTFYQPRAVWADLMTLETLSMREWRAGLAEVLKYALLDGREFFLFLQENAEAILEKKPAVILSMIEQCILIKAEIVQKDERDEGLRNILNLGHTFGHALEKATNFQKYRHGEAVAVGLVAALKLAEALQMINSVVVAEVLCLMQKWGLPFSFSSALVDDVLRFLPADKKVENQEVHFILPMGIGEVVAKKGIPMEIVGDVLKQISDIV
ncbi:MAG: 3-dehydroquinate synthase [Clostridia bacterium]|jgi:3-dehydroquinate synthase|nr:3-dehydroquinate synthase [Clostridia bacterium]